MSAQEIDHAVGDLIDADDLLQTLGALSRLRRLVDDEIRKTVPLALQVHPHAVVSRALGISRQQIYKRYSAARPGAVTPGRA